MRRPRMRRRRTTTAVLLAGALALGTAACEDTPLEGDIEQDIQEGAEDVQEGAEDLVDEAGSELDQLTDDGTESGG